MNILLSPDSFKGTLTSREVCEIEARAIRDVLPDAHVTTYGVGELLRDAQSRGAKRILLGLGGITAFYAASHGKRTMAELQKTCRKELYEITKKAISEQFKK